MKALVVNCSHGYYNLGAAKLANWLREQGYSVTVFDGDPKIAMPYPLPELVCLSVIFSWHAPLAAQIALRVKAHSEVWCGGPGMFALGKWWKAETGLACVRGLDSRFERQPGSYRMTFASRGCPVNCYFCIVPKLEGTEFTLYRDFTPAPILCDNNLSALPVEFQEHIIDRYTWTFTELVDANSGFEPRTFDGGTLERWTPILRGPWRFAFDTLDEEVWVRPMMALLRDVPASRKRVYCLIGNEPIEACYERALKIIEWGGEPYVQPMMPLNTLTRDGYKVAYDWTYSKLKDFARWANRWLWRSVPLAEYRPRLGQPAPFATAPTAPAREGTRDGGRAGKEHMGKNWRRGKSKNIGVTPNNAISERLWAEYEKFGTWVQVGKEHGVTPAMAFRVANGYEPRNNSIRAALGFPVLKPAPVCRCGEVHTRKTCPNRPPRTRKKPGLSPRQKRAVRLLAGLWR